MVILALHPDYNLYKRILLELYEALFKFINYKESLQNNKHYCFMFYGFINMNFIEIVFNKMYYQFHFTYHIYVLEEGRIHF